MQSLLQLQSPMRALRCSIFCSGSWGAGLQRWAPWQLQMATFRPSILGPLHVTSGDLCVSLQASSWNGKHVNAACPQVKVLDEQNMPPSGPCPTWPGTGELLLLPLFALCTDWA